MFPLARNSFRLVGAFRHHLPQHVTGHTGPVNEEQWDKCCSVYASPWFGPRCLDCAAKQLSDESSLSDFRQRAIDGHRLDYIMNIYSS